MEAAWEYQTMRAELAGQDVCRADTIEARSRCPVLSLCRKLIAAGIDPATRLEVCRGTTLSLRVRSIGEAADLTIRENDRRGPEFATWKAFPCDGGSAEEAFFKREGTPAASHAKERFPEPAPVTTFAPLPSRQAKKTAMPVSDFNPILRTETAKKIA